MAGLSVVSSAPTVAWMNSLIDVIDVYREIHPDMTLNQLVVLMAVAANHGISQKELAETVGLADSSVSRILAVLGEHGSRGTGPFNLVYMVSSDTDRRQRNVYLSKKGQALTSKVISIVSKGLK